MEEVAMTVMFIELAVLVVNYTYTTLWRVRIKTEG